MGNIFASGYFISPLSHVFQYFCLFRKQSEDLKEEYDTEMSEFAALKAEETESMLDDFNAAQELLKDKISALQIM